MPGKQIVWDEIGKHFYETGVSKGVLYKQVTGAYPLGVAWNGLTAVTEKPSGASSKPVYADGIKYLNLMSAEEFGATIEAFTYPTEFEACDGSASIAIGVLIGQQKRSSFGISYVTQIGNDVDGSDLGYKIHLVYGCTAAPSEKKYATINDTPEAISFSWEATTVPVLVTGFKPTACLTIDSTKVDADDLAAFEAILYGTTLVDPMLPLPDAVVALFPVVVG